MARAAPLAALLLLLPLAGCTVQLAHEEDASPGAGDAPSTPRSGAAPPATPPPSLPPDRDHDQDGLSTEEEVQLGTNGFQADSDGDGADDFTEIRVLQTQPRTADTDTDGLCDGAERAAGTQAMDPDTDGDGFLDGREGGWRTRAASFSAPACSPPTLPSWAQDLDPLGLDLVVKPFVMEGVQLPSGWEAWLRGRLQGIPLELTVTLLEPGALPAQAQGVPALPSGFDRPVNVLALVDKLEGNGTVHTYGWADTPGFLAALAVGEIRREEGSSFDAAFRQALLHELGHNLGLRHVAEGASPPPRTAMWATPGPNTSDDLTAQEWSEAARLFTSSRNREVRRVA